MEWGRGDIKDVSVFHQGGLAVRRVGQERPPPFCNSSQTKRPALTLHFHVGPSHLPTHFLTLTCAVPRTRPGSDLRHHRPASTLTTALGHRFNYLNRFYILWACPQAWQRKILEEKKFSFFAWKITLKYVRPEDGKHSTFPSASVVFKALLNFPHFNHPLSQQVCISASLQNKAVILYQSGKSTVLHLLAKAVCTCIMCAQTHRYTRDHRILLCACAMVRDAFVKQTHTSSCPHGAPILWQETSLLHPLETRFSHEEPAGLMDAASSLTFLEKWMALRTWCSWLSEPTLTQL